jgi:cellulose synthase/poly-beta-1,6-N-acetylglucosamine synthase-like glycosyltransferase
MEIIKKFKRVRLFPRKHAGPSAQRNFGVKNASGDIVLFTDSDCILPRNLLKRVIMDFKKYDVAGVGGTYKTLNKESAIARYVGYEIGYRHEAESMFTDFLGSYCSAYKRDIFLKYGGFDEKFLIASGEDSELSFRISKYHKLLLDKEMFVWHRHPDSFKRYMRTQFWRAYWRVLMYKKFPDKILGESYTGKEIPLASFFMTLFILSLLISFFYFNLIYLSMASLLFFYIVYIRLIVFAAKRDAFVFIVTFPILFIRTIVCLIGFLYGLVKFG